MPTPKGTKPWNAGTGKGWVDKRGYRWVYVTENGRRRAKREHRHIMEEHLGRRLAPEELVHHKNGDPSDNRIENLEIQGWSEHTTEHHNGARHREYTRKTQSVIAEYREKAKHLERVNRDLLEALKGVQSVADYLNLPQDHTVWQRARAAIAKAEASD